MQHSRHQPAVVVCSLCRFYVCGCSVCFFGADYTHKRLVCFCSSRLQSTLSFRICQWKILHMIRGWACPAGLLALRSITKVFQLRRLWTLLTARDILQNAFNDATVTVCCSDSCCMLWHASLTNLIMRGKFIKSLDHRNMWVKQWRQERWIILVTSMHFLQALVLYIEYNRIDLKEKP